VWLDGDVNVSNGGHTGQPPYPKGGQMAERSSRALCGSPIAGHLVGHEFYDDVHAREDSHQHAGTHCSIEDVVVNDLQCLLSRDHTFADRNCRQESVAHVSTVAARSARRAG
jgi:hypothetical protein